MIKKIFLCLVMVLLLSSFIFAQSDELFDYKSLDLRFYLFNEFDVVPVKSNYFLDFVSAELSWYPREDYRQIIDYISTDPESEFREGVGFLFEWKNPSKTSFLIEEEAKLTSVNEFKKVTKKISFPIKDLDPVYAEYLDPQKIIDINDDIKELASSIVQDEDDLYRAVFKLAIWVEQNVEYDLTTITAEAAQKASWVFENKRGVCDELTALFISLCRSLGIPARFVTGISYSNVGLQNDEWGPHGWAEVFFPGFGWIPFDITYKELGYIDAAHIKLKTSLDAKESSVSYSTKGRYTEIDPGPLEFDVSVMNKDFVGLKPFLELEADVAEQEVGFGSYNLLILTIKNPYSYYATTRLSLANVKELEVQEDNFRSIMLGPKEEKKFYWLIKISSDLRPGYTYTFPLSVVTTRGGEAITSFKSAEYDTVYSGEYMKLFIIGDEPAEKIYSRNVLITCTHSKEKISLNESVNISCVIDNKGDKTLRRLSICLNDDCASTRVPGRETARYDYTKSFDTLGVKTLVFKAENDLIEKSYYTIIEIKDKPLVEITDLDFPQSIDYNESSQITFFIRKKSHSIPTNLEISLEHELISEEWSIPSLEGDYEFKVMIRGEHLNLNRNDFEIKIIYEDDQSNEYKTTKDFSIILNKPKFLQKVMIWLNILESRIREWISKL